MKQLNFGTTPHSNLKCRSIDLRCLQVFPQRLGQIKFSFITSEKETFKLIDFVTKSFEQVANNKNKTKNQCKCIIQVGSQVLYRYIIYTAFFLHTGRCWTHNYYYVVIVYFYIIVFGITLYVYSVFTGLMETHIRILTNKFKKGTYTNKKKCKLSHHPICYT